MKNTGNNGKGNIEERDNWQTPQWLFDRLDKQYNFTFDCCADENNTKCNVWTDDFLDYNDDFCHDVSWMNPPFSKALYMFDNFFKKIKRGVCIYRCDNMGTKIWQDIIFKNADWILIPKKRISYEGKKGKGTRFPSALIGLNLETPKIQGTILLIKKIK